MNVAMQIDGSSRRKVSTKYFDKMTHSQIVVTVNPGNWEGDFRLWESMCTGALVFVDPIMVRFELLCTIYIGDLYLICH
jgi:hypothetical protein